MDFTCNKPKTNNSTHVQTDIESKNCWVIFTDGHTECWSDRRIQGELDYHGLRFVISQANLWLKYKKFYEHILLHKEVQEAETNKGKVICTICKKTFQEIVGDVE